MEDITLIKFKNVSAKSDRKSGILRNVSFSINRGESVVFFSVGKDVSKESGIKNIITGEKNYIFGKVRLNGEVRSLYNLPNFLNANSTGKRNIYSKYNSQSENRANIEIVEEEIIRFSELGDKINDPIKTYSENMKAQLAMAIGLYIDCDILVANSTISMNDEAYEEKCRKKISDFTTKGGVFLLFSNSISTAKKFCKRGIVIRNGRIIADDDIGVIFKMFGIVK